MHAVSTKQAFLFIWQMIRSFPGTMIVMLWVAIAWAVDLSVRPYLLKIILNRIAEPESQTVFAALALPVSFYLFMTVLMTTMFRLYDYFVCIKMVPRLRQRIASSIFTYLLQHSHHYYQNTFSGALANKINDLTSSIPDIIEITTQRFFSHALALIIATYTLWQVNIKFALAMALWAGLFIFISLFFAEKLRNFADKWSEIASTLTGKMVDVLSNILSVRLFARQAKEKALLERTFAEAVQAEQKLEWHYFYLWLVHGYSFVVMQIVCFYFLIQGRQQGLISVGDFALVLTINLSIVEFLWRLAKDFSEFSKLVGRVTQALRLTTAPIEIQDNRNAKTLVTDKGQIDFDRVHFHYKGAEPLFENLSVTINSGQKVGLVGYSGSGKTTFVNLILRLFDVTSGSILIDGQNIQDVTQESLRQAIGMIPQDPSLFHRTLIENIRYGHVGASEKAVMAAAKRAYAHDFIAALPEGYHALVGERGVKLSGGQRQRIAIARAILKNAPILILDEATSQLDSITESYIQDSLWELMQGKTTLVVAHRLSTLLQMDRIIVFDQGKIIEDGAHGSLLDKGGLYKLLWDAQVGGFLPENHEKINC